MKTPSNRSRRGAPDLEFYEKIGRTNFQLLASHSTARRCELNDVYEKLADRFHEVRLALNRLSDELPESRRRPQTRRFCFDETLFSQIQGLFERTYAQVGINLEDCLIDQRRCRQLSRLAGASAVELSELARTFLRTADDNFTSEFIIRAG